MTAHEFAEAAALAEAAVYALYLSPHSDRVDPQTEAAAQQSRNDAENEPDPIRKTFHLLRAISEELGSPPLRIVENQLGLISIRQPSLSSCAAMTISQLATALGFALNAVYHHKRRPSLATRSG